LVPAQNAQGSTYYFDLGAGVSGAGVSGAGVSGTGVGCSQVAGTQGRSLVGLKLIRDSSGNPQSVERTQIITDGTQARNGAHDTVSATGPPRRRRSCLSDANQLRRPHHGRRRSPQRLIATPPGFATPIPWAVRSLLRHIHVRD